MLNIVKNSESLIFVQREVKACAIISVYIPDTDRNPVSLPVAKINKSEITKTKDTHTHTHIQTHTHCPLFMTVGFSPHLPV